MKPHSPGVTPLPFNHIGMTVPDIERAIRWYGDVLGFRLIFRRTLQLNPDVPEVQEIFGPAFRRALQAHLVSANGVGLELFQFLEPEVEMPEQNFRYQRGGVFHLCVTDPDLPALVERVVAHGGRQRTKIWTFLPDRPYQLVYLEDCFGNVIEGFSHPYTQTFANMPGWHAVDE